MTERQYAEAGGKRYPLKTPEERAAAQSSPAATPQPTRQSSPQVSGSSSVNVPTPHGSRTVVLAMLVSFGTFALAGPTGISKLSRLQGYLGSSSTVPGANALTSVPSDGGAGSGGTPAASVFSPKAIFGWMMLFVMLTILSDFDATSELAGAFAMLIMLTTLITLGPDAFANLNKLTKVV